MMPQPKTVTYDGNGVSGEEFVKQRIVSFAQKLNFVYQEKDTITKIMQCVMSNGGISVYPEYPVEADEMKKSFKLRLQDLGQEVFAYVTTSLGAVCNFRAKDRPTCVLLEVLLISHNKPTSLFVITNSSESEGIDTYTRSLALGVKDNILTFIDDHFSLVYGHMVLEDLDSNISFIKALDKIKEDTSDHSLSTTLYMSPEKFVKVTRAFLMSVSLTLMTINGSDSPCFLTVDQFKVLTENIDMKHVEVLSKSSDGKNVLMMEVARRLEKSGTTLLVMESEDAIELARERKICSFPVHGKDLKEFLKRKNRIWNVVSTVEHNNFEHLHFEHFWHFLSEDGAVLSVSVQDIVDRTHDDILHQTAGLPKPSKVGQITSLFKESGMKLVTVTGNSGSGKSIISLMVLEELHKYGYMVFSVHSPEDYFKVSKLHIRKAILFNNIFGAHNLDTKNLPEWQKILETLAHTEEKSPCFQDMILLSGSRDSIAKNLPLNLKHWLLESKRTIDLRGVNLISEDKEIILNHLLQKNGLSMISSDKSEICQQQFDHGFIHSCLMYVTLRKSNTVKESENKTFFLDPLRYIERIVIILLNLGENYGAFLKGLVQKGGSVIHDGKAFEEFHHLMKNVLLRRKKDKTEFRHPSIHARIACTLANTEPAFLKEACTEAVIIHQLKYVQQKPEDNKQIFVTPECREFVTGKLTTEIDHLNFSSVECEMMKTPEICTQVLKLFAEGNETSKMNRRDHKDETLLDVACRCKNKPAINFLLLHDVDINGIHMKGETLLHRVCDQADVDFEILKQLVEKGADVNIKDSAGKTLLFYLCEKQNLDGSIRKAVCFLLGKVTDINEQDENGNTALFPLTENVFDQCEATEFPDEEVSGSYELFEEFLKRGADPLKPNKQGMNIVIYICIKGLVKPLSLVIKHLGCKASSELSKWNLLHVSCATVRLNPNIVGELLVTKQNILSTDRHGKTPLHILSQGPTIHDVEKGSSRETLLAYSKDSLQRRQEDIAALLLVRRGISYRRKTGLQSLPTPLSCPSSTSGFSSTDSSKDKKWNRKISKKTMFHDYANMTDNNKRTALHLLSMREGSEISRPLFEILTVASNIEMADDSGMTAIHYLVLNGTLGFVKEKVTAKNVDLPVTPVFESGIKHTQSGQTALHLACTTTNPKPDLVEFLIITGADVNKRDSNGKKPCDIIEQQVECVLKDAGQTREISPEERLKMQGKRKEILHLLHKYEDFD